HLHDAAPLLGGQTSEFAGRAVRVESVNAVLDQPGDETPLLPFIDLATFVQRYQGWCENAFQFRGHRGRMLRLSAYCLVLASTVAVKQPCRRLIQREPSADQSRYGESCRCADSRATHDPGRDASGRSSSIPSIR